MGGHLSGRTRVVVYNTDSLTEADLPADFWGFADERRRGRLGWPPTDAFFQTMVTGMGALWGDERAREWLEAIQANEPVIYPKNTPIVAAVGASEIDVGLVNHYYLHQFLAEEGESFPPRNYHLPDGGPGSFVMVTGAGILATASNCRGAESSLDFLLSPVGQQCFASQTHEYPLVESVATGRNLVPLQSVNNPAIPLIDLADLEGTQRMLREVGILP